jgi:hypothetical protein
VGLPKAVKKLGDITGRDWPEIEALVGKPSTGHSTADGGKSGQWAKGRFAITVDAANRVSDVRERKPGELDLSWRLRSLGNIMGMERSEMVKRLGAPNAISTGAGFTLLQWQCPGYHVALKFAADESCLGITHQFAKKRA